MRRLGKRILAITLAVAMMTSLTPQGCAFLQQEIVYAAETGGAFYEQTGTVSVGELDLQTEDWSNKPEAKITEAVTDTQCASNFDMTAAVIIDEAGYQSLQTGENYLKVQGVVKLGADWTWTDSQDIPYLDASKFTKDGDAYKAGITIKFRDKDAGELKGVYFEIVGKGFKGTVSFANTKLTEVQVVPTTTESLAYTCTETKNLPFDFSALAEEDWGDSMPAVTLATGVNGSKITDNAVYRGKVTIDQATYDSLAAERSYIKLQTVVKIGDDWTWTQGGSYPCLNQTSFTANGDGTYSAPFEDKYSGTGGGDLHEVILRAVGIGAKGTLTISDVTISNLVSNDDPLPEKAPTDIDTFESYTVGAGTESTGWKHEDGWQYDKKITPVVASVDGSKALKLNLDYTGCEGYTWSEAKVNRHFETGYDVSAYNVLSYDIIYPAEFDGFKTKVFAKESASGTEIINKEGTLSDTVTLADGTKKSTVMIKFSPNSAVLDELTIGTVGVSTAFKGDIYIDNVKLSQYDAAGDFVEITATPSAKTQADINGMPTSVSLADTGATAETRALYSYLQNLDAKNQVLFGHQNDTHKSVNPNAKDGSDCKDITGSISGLVGIDSLALTGTELGLDNTDDAIAKAIEIGKDVAKQGGIVSLSTHMPNMGNSKIKTVTDANGNITYDFSECDFAESKDLSNNCAKEELPGGKYNEQFKAYLDIIAKYANGLKDEDGNLIPVLFRPFHECDGGWFWWGSAATDNETYKALFRYMEDYLNEQGVDNFIYVYSPGGPIEEDYLDRYPGDEYVDVLAFDYYDDYSSADAAYSDEYVKNLKSSCNSLKKIADAHGKVAAIGEAGVRVMKADGSDQEGILVKNNPIKGQNWYKQVNEVAKETGMSYLLLWANFSDTNFYIPYKYNDTKGQELINEFIDFYNEDSSVFADGTNFYGKADTATVANTNTDAEPTGYITSIISKEVIKKPTALKANVKNADKVSFVLQNGETKVTLDAVKGTGNEYTAEVSAANLTKLGKTDTGTIILVADGKTLSTLNFISFGKEKDVLPKDVIENFELYYGDDNYLAGTFSQNSAAGCSSSFALSKENTSGGNYGGAFTYTLKNTTSEVWTGQIKGTLTNNDFSGYNAIQMWVKPDKVNKKMVVQLTDDSGEEFEVYLSDFTSNSDKAQYVTIPFASFKGKQNGTLNTANIQKFAVWCNSVENNTNVTSTIYLDEIKAVNITAAQIASKDQNGLIITDNAIGATGTNNGGGGTASSGDTSGSTVTKPDGSSNTVANTTEKNVAGNTVKVTTTTTKDNSGKVTSVVETSVIENAAKGTSVTVTVKKNADNKIVSAEAEVTKTGTKTVKGTRGTISSAVVAQITETAGTKDVEIIQTVVDTSGKTLYTVTVNASDLKAGDKLKIFKYDKKKDAYILVNNKDYKVSNKGGVELTIKGNSSYKLLNRKDADKIVKEVLATVKVTSSSKTVSEGKVTKISLSKKLNMENVSKIKYSSTKSSVAKVDKNGKITAKKAGTTTIKAKVTLKNGKTKTVTMKIKVK